MKITKVEIKQLAESLYFRVDENQLHELEWEFVEIAHEMEIMKKVNTNHVLPMVYPLVEFSANLRADLPQTTFADETLNNVKTRLGKYVVVN